MTDPDLADRILAALADAERLERQPIVRSDQLLARLAAAEHEVRSALYALDSQGRVRFTPGFAAGDVVVLAANPADRGADGGRDPRQDR